MTTAYQRTELAELVASLQAATGILHKHDIQAAASTFGQFAWGVDGAKIRLGDDCAAVPAGDRPEDGYLLLAAEGIWPELVVKEPWFAGWCAVMVNLSDIAAMGGKTIALVDALWSQSATGSAQVWAGMRAAADRYGVPIVGGHTNSHSNYEGLAVAVMGQAKCLITSFDGQVGDALMMVVNLSGAYFGEYSFWNAATETESVVLKEQLSLLPKLSALGLCHAGKDISMGGLAGTLLMLCEASGYGAVLNLDCVPKPEVTSWERWLTSFPSFGFLLSVPKGNVSQISALFSPFGLSCEVIGEAIAGSEVFLQQSGERQRFWDLESGLTGFNGAAHNVS